MFKRLAVIIFLILLPLVFSFGQDRIPASHQMQNLTAFARLYGYVRYFHPSDEAASIDWNSFAIYGAKQVAAAKSADETEQIFKNLFMPVAPSMSLYKSGDTPEFSKTEIIPGDTASLKVVAWQHLGIGLNDRSIYKSARTNRRPPAAGGFGNTMRTIPADLYRAKKIRYRASVKAESDPANGGHLWVRVDRPNRARGFFDNMTDRPILVNEWKEYEITGEVADDAVDIAFGCFLTGPGSVWLDNARLSVQEQGVWKPIDIGNGDFEGDTMGQAPKDWSAKSEGYAISVTGETAAEGKQSLSIKYVPAPIGSALFDAVPAVGECMTKDLGNGLSAIIPLALYSDTIGTIPHGNPLDVKNLTSAIDAEMKSTPASGDERATRLGDIVIAWNVFRNFYPYYDVETIDWQFLLHDALTGAYNDKNKDDFHKTLRRMTSRLNDGHVRVNLDGDSSELYYAPVEWEWIDHNLVITNVIDSSIKQLHAGDIVGKIDGISSKTAVEHEEEYISAATPQWKRHRSLGSLLSGRENSSMELSIRDGSGKSMNVRVPRSLPLRDYYQKIAEYNRPLYRAINDSIAYVDLNSLTDDTLPSLFPKLSAARAIIFDVRGYPRSFDILSHLAGKTLQSARWNIPQTIYPDHDSPAGFDTSGRWDIAPKEPILNGRMVFITDGRAISAAETFMGIIEYYKLGAIIGGTTAGTNGDVNVLRLPGGYSISSTGMKVLKHDGSQHHGIGIHPTIPMERTIKGVREGRDELLEKAIEVVSK